MAKQFKPKTSGITVNDTEEVNVTEGNVENPVETVEESVSEATETTEVKGETEPTDDVKVNPDIEQKPAVKNVKILPKQNHTCCIGGTRYCLKKDVQTNVPVGVKEILNRAGLLKPL